MAANNGRDPSDVNDGPRLSPIFSYDETYYKPFRSKLKNAYAVNRRATNNARLQRQMLPERTSFNGYVVARVSNKEYIVQRGDGKRVNCRFHMGDDVYNKLEFGTYVTVNLADKDKYEITTTSSNRQLSMLQGIIQPISGISGQAVFEYSQSRKVGLDLTLDGNAIVCTCEGEKLYEVNLQVIVAVANPVGSASLGVTSSFCFKPMDNRYAPTSKINFKRQSGFAVSVAAQGTEDENTVLELGYLSRHYVPLSNSASSRLQWADTMKIARSLEFGTEVTNTGTTNQKRIYSQIKFPAYGGGSTQTGSAWRSRSCALTQYDGRYTTENDNQITSADYIDKRGYYRLFLPAQRFPVLMPGTQDWGTNNNVGRRHLVTVDSYGGSNEEIVLRFTGSAFTGWKGYYTRLDTQNISEPLETAKQYALTAVEYYDAGILMVSTNQGENVMQYPHSLPATLDYSGVTANLPTIIIRVNRTAINLRSHVDRPADNTTKIWPSEDELNSESCKV